MAYDDFDEPMPYWAAGNICLLVLSYAQGMADGRVANEC